MKKLLIFVDWFLPGYKAGGQLRSCANLAYALKDDMEVYVVTSDRDMGDPAAYPSIKADEWNILANSLRVHYLSPGNRGLTTITRIIRSIQPDCIYLNSMYSVSFTLLPIEACGKAGSGAKIVLAPRGMLHQGALQYKKMKKKIFFRMFTWRGLHKKIIFHATDPTEEADIRKTFGNSVAIEQVNDFPASEQAALAFTGKQRGSLRCLFVSRISPKKNLLYVLSVLQQVKAHVVLSIAGPPEDEPYWLQCKRSIASLPANITVDYLGSVANHELPAVYLKHHLLVLPTHGENFGHVIFDALLHGRPVLISDHTPWKNLKEKNIGWDIPLKDNARFVQAVEGAAAWNQPEFDAHCKASWQYAAAYLHASNLKNEYLQLFT